ncbi:hypothetical protein [Streptomyces lasiicapitis]|uniref:hypothetical protein n=1 Tax=Streptomyces lasiicapitis TaxID=1923961 RepID=UPI0036AE0839
MQAEVWVAIAAVTIAAVGVVVGLVAAARARIKEIEDVYLQHYWEILDKLPSAALVGQKECCTSDEHRRIARLYLRLCEDELQLRASGWVSRRTWPGWRNGMLAQIGKWPVADEWQRITCGDLRYTTRGQYGHLRKLDSDPQYEPFKARWITKVWRRL